MGPLPTISPTRSPSALPDSNSPKRKDVQVPEDQVQLATVPLLAQVEEIQKTDTSSFQAVLSDAIRKLRVAAAETSDPTEAAYFSDLANRFSSGLKKAGQPGVRQPTNGKFRKSK